MCRSRDCDSVRAGTVVVQEQELDFVRGKDCDFKEAGTVIVLDQECDFARVGTGIVQ